MFYLENALSLFCRNAEGWHCQVLPDALNLDRRRFADCVASSVTRNIFELHLKTVSVLIESAVWQVPGYNRIGSNLGFDGLQRS